MSRYLRYQHPDICQHLAGQYVAGVMTSRVKARTESLRQTQPELDRAIAYWSDQFSTLDQQLNESQLTSLTNDQLWNNIQSTLSLASKPLASKESSPADKYSSMWNQVSTWQWLSGISAFASVVLAVMLWLAVPLTQTTIAGPSYLASMAAHGDPANTVKFIISAYKTDKNKPSQLHIQWSQRQTKVSHPPLHLWAEDKDTGQLSYIGLQPESNEAWNLSKPSWKAIANSHRLLMTVNNQPPTDTNTVFSGLCLQLKQWKS